MENNIIYESENFNVIVPIKPHISRLDGGHIVISGKRYINNRTELTPKEAIEVMRITMILGEAMLKGLNRNNINVERINDQENGNWAYLNNEEPFFHIHLYGRVKNSTIQKWGEALYFPDPNTNFYDNFDSLNSKDIKYIQEEIYKLENTDKYNIKNWK